MSQPNKHYRLFDTIVHIYDVEALRWADLVPNKAPTILWCRIGTFDVAVPWREIDTLSGVFKPGDKGTLVVTRRWAESALDISRDNQLEKLWAANTPERGDPGQAKWHWPGSLRIHMDTASSSGPTEAASSTSTSDPGLHVFPSGATRSTDVDHWRFDLVSPYALRALAARYAKGVPTHGESNWLKGIPFSALLNHLQAHLADFRLGSPGKDNDVENLAAVMWGCAALIHFLKTGRTELDDRPYIKELPYGPA